MLGRKAHPERERDMTCVYRAVGLGALLCYSKQEKSSSWGEQSQTITNQWPSHEAPFPLENQERLVFTFADEPLRAQRLGTARPPPAAGLGIHSLH